MSQKSDTVLVGFTAAMNIVENIVIRALGEGLPEKESDVALRSGCGSLAAEAEKAGWDYTELVKILYGQDNSGLVSGLKRVTNDATESVKKGWGSCKELNPLLIKLSQFSEPSQELLIPVKEALKQLIDVRKTLKSCQSGSKNSLLALLTHLEKFSNPELRKFHQQVTKLEANYNWKVSQREVLENDFEKRRIENRGELETRGSVWLADNATPWAIREIWRQPANKEGQYIFVNDDKERANTKDTPDQWARKTVLLWAAQVWSAQVDGDSVNFPMMDKIDKAEHDQWRDWVWIKPFYMIMGRQQAIVKALTEKDGPWRFEEDHKNSYLGAIKLRDLLDTSESFMREVSELVRILQSKSIPTMVELGDKLLLDLEDLYANLYFGDKEDQNHDLEMLQKSVDKWNFAFTKYSQDPFSAVSAADKFAQAEIVDCKQVVTIGRQNFNSTKVITALTKFDNVNDKDFGVKAFLHSQGVPIISNWGNSTTLNAKATFLEVPDRDELNCGTESASCKDSDHSRDFSKQLNLDVLVNFKTEYGSPPTVVCWISGLDISLLKYYRLRVDAVDVTNLGFTLRVSTWADTRLHHATASWLAYPADSPHITSGTHLYFNSRGMHSDVDFGPSQYISFPGKFQDPPKVFSGISKIDQSNFKYPRFKVSQSDISKDGMRLSGHAWADTDCYGAAVSYVAFDAKYLMYKN